MLKIWRCGGGNILAVAFMIGCYLLPSELLAVQRTNIDKVKKGRSGLVSHFRFQSFLSVVRE